MEQADWFRSQLTALGFTLVPGRHPIIPVMLGEATARHPMAERLLQERDLCRGIQLSGRAERTGSHSLCSCLRRTAARNSNGPSPAFAKVGRELKVIA